MKQRHRGVPAALSVVLFLISAQPASGQESTSSTDLLNVTCADYLEGLRMANPGTQATAEQKVAAEDAQDDIVSALMWVHGYTSGRRSGTDLSPLTRDWMRDTVVKLAQSCKSNSADGRMRLADAATRL